MKVELDNVTVERRIELTKKAQAIVDSFSEDDNITTDDALQAIIELADNIEEAILLGFGLGIYHAD